MPPPVVALPHNPPSPSPLSAFIGRMNKPCPGFVATPLLDRAGITPGTDMYAMIADLHPIKRLGTPEEIAEAVLWLCSEKASFVTGDAMLVDGGYVAQ